MGSFDFVSGFGGHMRIGEMSCSRNRIKPVTLKPCRLESRTLACQKVDAPRTAEAISSDIDGILDDWCLKGKVRSLMRLALLLVPSSASICPTVVLNFFAWILSLNFIGLWFHG